MKSLVDIADSDQVLEMKMSGCTISWDFFVENGIECLVKPDSSTAAIDICCVAIEVIGDGQQTFAFSQSRPFPLSKVQQMHTLACPGVRVGQFCENYYADLKLPISRQDQVHSATKMALAQIGYTFTKK